MCQRARVVMRSRACVSIHTQTNTCMQTTCASGFGHTGHHAGVLQTSKRDAGNGAVPGSGHVQNAGSRLRAPAGAQRARFALCIRSRARAEDGCATAPSRGQQCCRGEQTPTVKLHLRGRRARRRAAASRPRPRRRRSRVRHFMVALGCRMPKWRTDGVRRVRSGREKKLVSAGVFTTPFQNCSHFPHFPESSINTVFHQLPIFVLDFRTFSVKETQGSGKSPISELKEFSDEVEL